MTYTYANRLRSALSLSAPSASPWTQSYGYDAARRLTSVTSPAGSFGYSYDSLRQTLPSKLNLPPGSYITNTYDVNARLLSTVLKNSGNTTLNSHTYSYNTGNQRTQQVFTAGNFVNYTYDKSGQLVTALGSESGGTTNRWNEQFGYFYDAAGNLNRRTNNALFQTFNVNSLNELTTGTRSGTLTVAGTTAAVATNVTVNTSNAFLYADATFASTNQPLVDGNNTFTAIGKDSYGRSDTNSSLYFLPSTNVFAYDANGNMLTNGTRFFEYDDENQLIRITEPNGWKSEFDYDGNMRRRVRREYSWVGGAWSKTNEVRYVYDGNLVIQERDVNNNPAVSYTRGHDLSGSFQGSGGIGGLLARTDNSLLLGPSSLPPHAYYAADASGNVDCLVSTNQNLAAKYIYDPFGNIVSQSGPLADANLYRFSSKELHANSGLECYLYRFYSTAHQKWLTRDPLAELAGPNLYTYVGNKPVGSVDPLGLDGDAPQLGTSGSSGGYCAALKSSIARLERNIRGSIRSVNDVRAIYDNVFHFQNVGIIAEGVYALVGARTMEHELHSFARQVFKPAGGLAGAAAGGAFTMLVDEGMLRIPGAFGDYLTHWNFLNSAESAAEFENEMASELSESTYRTIQNLQGMLRSMLGAYDKHCGCVK